MSEAPLRATRCGASSVLTLLFGKAFFRIHFSLRLEGLPVPIERKVLRDRPFSVSGRPCSIALVALGLKGWGARGALLMGD